MTKRVEIYAVRRGTTINPGEILATFTSAKTYRCGGPATACLAWFAAHVDKPGAGPMTFGRVRAEAV